ncbi:MAG: RDD family protein [Pseudomonadota bacterium]
MNATDGLTAPPLARRMACWLYEGMLLFGVVFTAGLVFSVATQMRSGIDARHGLFQAFLFVVCGVYCTVLWTRGQTLAMKTWDIRVADRFGRPLTPLRAVIRYVYSWIWFLPPLAALQARKFGIAEAAVLWLGWVAFWALLSRLHPQRQFWHDALAGTRLVTAAP